MGNETPKIKMLSRVNTYNNDLIILDGMWGTGKSLISPIINGFQGVAQFRIDGFTEFIAILNSMGEISENTASVILQQRVDAITFSSACSREINLRYYDDSSHLKNFQWKRYLHNLFTKDKGQFDAGIIANNPASFLMTHNLRPTFQLFHHAFGSRLKFIEIKRHPVYCLKYWSEYLPRIGVDAKEQTLTINNINPIPWFITDEDEYLKASNIEKAIISYKALSDLNNQDKNIAQNILSIPLESFIKDTDRWVQQLKIFLARELKFDARKNVQLPRLFLEGFNGPAKSAQEEKEYYESCLSYIRDNSSEEKFLEFMDDVNRYEKNLDELKNHS